MANKIFHCSILSLSVISDILIDSKGNIHTWSVAYDEDGEAVISLFNTPYDGGAYHVADFTEIYATTVPVNKPFSVVALPIDGKLVEFVALSLAKVVVSAVGEIPKRTTTGFRPINWDSLIHYGLYVSRLHESLYSNSKRTLRSKVESVAVTDLGDVVFLSETGEYSIYCLGRGNMYNVSATRAIGNPPQGLTTPPRTSDIPSYYELVPHSEIFYATKPRISLSDVFRTGRFNTVKAKLHDGKFLQARISFNFSSGVYRVELVDSVVNVLSVTGNDDIIENLHSSRHKNLVIVADYEIEPFEELTRTAMADGTYGITTCCGQTLLLQFSDVDFVLSYDMLVKDLGRLRDTARRTEKYLKETTTQRLSQGSFIGDCSLSIHSLFADGDNISTDKHTLVLDGDDIHVLDTDKQHHLLTFSTKNLSQVSYDDDITNITFVLSNLINVTV